MMKYLLPLLLLSAFRLLPMGAQSVTALMTTTAPDGTVEENATSYNGSAPMTAEFDVELEDADGYTAFFQWNFTESDESEPYLTRHDQSHSYTFSTSGTTSIDLYVWLVEGTDTLEYDLSSVFTITILESYLEFPNTFTPNGDGQNDILRAIPDTYQSIVDFEATVFNRWGKKICSWTDIADGWDGTIHGKDAPVGAYYLNVRATGADGRKYHIRKTINLLRDYIEENDE